MPNKTVETISALKAHVYLIVRGRKFMHEGKELFKWITLGTGFLAGSHRFITAGHVINDETKNEFFKHKKGDKYYFLKHTDDHNIHWHLGEYALDKEIFLYPECDIAVVHLKEKFYKSDGKVFADEDSYVSIEQDFKPIGIPIGILGYPLSKLEFDDRDINKPKIGNILMRTDTGVINTRYQTAKDKYLYEFTIAFNPGNSGGPIFDLETGRIVSIVKGFRAIPIATTERIIQEAAKKNLKNYTEDSFIETLHAVYSVGFASPTFTKVFKEHNII